PNNEQPNPSPSTGNENTPVEQGIEYEIVEEDKTITNQEDLTTKLSKHYKKMFAVSPGNRDKGTAIEIGQNLRVDGNFNMKNQGCLAVGNDLILNGSTYVGAQFDIYVYGNL